ncbi:hypothetical protein OROHE_017054 [Orobanche hederae]
MIGEGEEKAWKKKKVYILRALAFVLFMALFVGIYGALEPVNKAGGSKKRVFSKGNYAATARERRLLTTEGDRRNNGEGGYESTNRVGIGGQCSKDNILVFQGATSPLPNGIPTYTVEIHNVCLLESCGISNIHMSCGWFSSARLINPMTFRRIGYNDCLVNNGEPLNPGDALSFQYANTFKYQLAVLSVSCY